MLFGSLSPESIRKTIPPGAGIRFATQIADAPAIAGSAPNAREATAGTTGTAGQPLFLRSPQTHTPLAVPDSATPSGLNLAGAESRATTAPPGRSYPENDRPHFRLAPPRDSGSGAGPRPIAPRPRR